MFRQSLPETVVVELVIRSHRDETAPGTAQGVEDLRGGVSPHLQGQNHKETEAMPEEKK